ncbi:endonuclease, partial [Roseovarius sp. A21]
MPKVDAVSAVTGDLFAEGWSRVRGSMQGLTGEPKRLQMARAARGHRAAVFKAIRSGGCHTRAELVRQLDYLTTKSSHIVDSRGVLDGKETLTGKEIEAVADRYVRRWSDGFHPKLGQTTHMLMSFPIGTKGEDVRDIASEVCERFFSNDEDGRHFDYLIAVHEDRDHPHAHVVLNRKSQEGEFFYLGRDHHFNYDAFRIAMVEAAEKIGVRLEATRRVHRGVIDYPPRTREVYAAREEGRAALGRERFGGDLTATQAEIKAMAREYAQLGAKEPDGELRAPLMRAGGVLESGGQLEPTGHVYTAEALRARFNAAHERAQARIEAASPAERPGMQKHVYDTLKPLAHTKPLDERSHLLNEPPSDTEIYSTRNIDPARLERLRDPEIESHIGWALIGTGISSESVIARIEAGADNEALENDWLDEDARQIAAYKGLNLQDADDNARTWDMLNRAFDRIAIRLNREGILRTDGIEAEDHGFHFEKEAFEDRCRAIRQDLRDEGLNEDDLEARRDDIDGLALHQLKQEQADYLARHRDIIGSPEDVYRANAEGEREIVDLLLLRQFADVTEAVMKDAGTETDPVSTVAGAYLETYPDMPKHLARGLGDTHVLAAALWAQTGKKEWEAELERRAETRALRESDPRVPKGQEKPVTDIKPLDISNFPDIARTVAYEKLEPSEQRETA